MDTSFHYLLLAAQGMFQRRILARLAGSGLTAGQMEEKGLVERRAEGGDRRALHVYLTDFGWEKQREVLRVLEACDREMLSGLDEAEGAALLRGLRHVCEHLAENREALQ